MTEKLIVKAYEGFLRKEKESQTNVNRALKEKLNFNEEDLKRLKIEYEEERAS